MQGPLTCDSPLAANRARLVKLLQQRARPNEHPLSSAQRRLWFLTQLSPDSSNYHMFSAVGLEGYLSVSALDQSIREIARRHDTLRTVFRIRHAEPVQVVLDDGGVRLTLADLRGLSVNREMTARQFVREETARAFDLEEGPLFRVRLLWLADTEYVLAMTLHHIVSDGWSQGVLLRELSELYERYSAGDESSLEELEIQYSDYTSWQQQWSEGQVYHRQLDYWRSQLAGLETLRLPTDHPRPQVLSFRGAREQLVVEEDVLRRLRDFARGESSTLYMVLLAGFVALLQRYCRQREVVVGTTTANRNRIEIEGLIGCFVNLLVLRLNAVEEMTFQDLMKEVREVCLGAYENQDLPFEQLVDELQPERDLSRNPLVQVTFLLSASSYELRFRNVKLKPAEHNNPTSKFDWTMEANEYESWLQVELEYCIDLFEPETINRAVKHYATLLSSAVSNPEQRIGQLHMLSAAERHQLVSELNETEKDYELEVCIHELIGQRAELSCDSVAVVCGSDAITYKELNERANRLSHNLRKLGVGPDAVAGICVERSVELVLGMLGILKAGGAYLPLDPSYPAERLHLMLKDSAAVVLLTNGALRNELAASGTPMRNLPDLLETGGPEYPPSPVLSENLAYVLYTSGSTGKPKGVMIAHRALANHMAWMQESFPLGENDTVLQKTPCTFDASVWEFWAPLLAGGRLVIAEPGRHADAGYLTETIRREKVTTLQVVPMQLQMLLEEGLSECISLARVFCGGGPLTEDLAVRLREQLGMAVVNLYGPTEATIDAMHWQSTDSDKGRDIPIGRPISNTRTYVFDGGAQPAPIGVLGELFIAGEGLARGYLGAPALTAERFIPDPYAKMPGERLYRTGDICRHRARGELEFIGRRDQQVKLRGYRIELGEIEAVMRKHEGVRNCALVVNENGRGGGRLVAYVVPHSAQALFVGELRDFVRQHLPEYMTPLTWVMLDHLPLTASGKVDLKLLPAPEAADREDGKEYTTAQTKQQQIVAGIWEQILQVDRVGIEETFFEAGGHSLLLADLSKKLTKALGREVSILDLFRYPTISSFAASLEGSDPPGVTESVGELEEQIARGRLRREERLLLLRQKAGEVG